ncbi:hypothetical protein CZ774_10195 [Frigoribacterium sp. JB110]|nr:hypothetical protein CZ774_10195 [Frigoribacterium sp. JB110]
MNSHRMTFRRSGSSCRGVIPGRAEGPIRTSPHAVASSLSPSGSAG